MAVLEVVRNVIVEDDNSVIYLGIIIYIFIYCVGNVYT